MAVQALCREGIAEGFIRSAHDLSDGGLGVALAEACLASPASGLGASVRLPEGAGRLDSRVFGEAASRILASIPPEAEGRLREAAGRLGVGLAAIGTATGSRLRIEAPDGFPVMDLEMSALRAAWAGALDEVFGA
jgi:phosphoribosylformylglycinamidine synthase